MQHVDARRHANGDDVRMSRVALLQLHGWTVLVTLGVQVGVFDLGGGSLKIERMRKMLGKKAGKGGGPCCGRKNAGRFPSCGGRVSCAWATCYNLRLHEQLVTLFH